MVTVLQNTQVLLLSAVLLSAGLAKLTIRERAAATLRHGRRTGVGLGLAEGALGAALLVSSHSAVRIGTTMVFASATWVVGELRSRRADVGCGCFGGLSDRPVDRRGVLRATLLTGAALVSIGAPHAGLEVLRRTPVQVAVLLAVELALFAALSPELAALRERLAGGPVRPSCARRRSTLGESLARLRASDAWLAYENAIASAAPLDVWREGCWRFLLYPARVEGRPAGLVFAVSTAERDRTVRSALVTAVPAAGEARAIAKSTAL
ncbi:MauE/DoxX family redox-associated membrane protein [Actinomadura macrotermitis]|uniref:Methylamine utilisation protein MauE domain-containing protein n=1 Tax=Actinomadura macrotermitis TaxID=2585200 RepID=A0A7K0BVC0_9ACTN|nr:MauE/DoxX family redox-associated membrane protein [Actinomadura macrotermitis]MQY05119.1 hypothetical protein [Actinomadura macrotermitis]